VIHRVLAIHYTYIQKHGDKMPLVALQDAFRDDWNSEMDKPIPIRFNKQDDGQTVDQGVSMLQVFHEQSDVPVVKGVEVPFAIPLADPETGIELDMLLVGAFDLVTGGDKVCLWDHKTSARKPTKDQLGDHQMTIYRHAAEMMGFGTPELRLQYLIKTKVPQHLVIDIQRSKQNIREALETIIMITKAVDAGAFFRIRGWQCHDCAHAYVCNGGSS